MTSHRRDGDREPVRYAWIRDSLLVAGTLADYAQMWEGDQWACQYDLTVELLTWDGKNLPVVHEVQIDRGGTYPDGIDFLIRVPGTGEVQKVRLPAGVAGHRSM